MLLMLNRANVSCRDYGCYHAGMFATTLRWLLPRLDGCYHTEATTTL